MSPLNGLKVFSHAWSKIARDLLQADPWNFNNGSPKGHQKAIQHLDKGAAFAVMATLAEENAGIVSRESFWKLAAESELADHGISLQSLKENNSFKQMEVYEKIEKRLKKEIDELATLFQHYGLFIELAGNKYEITEEGRRRFSELKA